MLEERFTSDLGARDRLGPASLLHEQWEVWDIVRGKSLVARAWCVAEDLIIFAGDTIEVVGTAFQRVYRGVDDEFTVALATAAKPKAGALASITFRWPSLARRALPKPTRPVTWSKLKHQNGSARGVPSAVKRLAFGNTHEQSMAYQELVDALVYPIRKSGRWFDSSAPTVDLLLSAVTQANDPTKLLSLSADILGSDHARAFTYGPSNSKHARAARTAALRHERSLLSWLTSASPGLRAGAALVIACLAELEDAVEHLSNQWEREMDESVAGALSLALACFGEVRDWHDGGTALAQLRADATLAWVDAPDLVERWLEWEPHTTFPWFAFRHAPGEPGRAARGLAALAEHRNDHTGLVETILAIAANLDRPHSVLAASEVLRTYSAVKRRREHCVPYSKLNRDERSVAQPLANSWLLPRGGHGLPAAGTPRQRWAGELPPGVLDQGKKPLWSTLARNRKGQAKEIPTVVPSQGPERLQVLLELADGVYGIGLQLTELEIDEELKRISPDRAAIKELFTRSRLSTRTPSSTALALAVLSLSRPPSEYAPHVGIFNNGRIYDRVAERFTLKARERAALLMLDSITPERAEIAIDKFHRFPTTRVKERLRERVMRSQAVSRKATLSRVRKLKPTS